jgi:phospholipase D1/2
MIPEVPGFVGDISSSDDLKKILAATWRTINRGGHSIYASLASRVSRVTPLTPPHRRKFELRALSRKFVQQVPDLS